MQIVKERKASSMSGKKKKLMHLSEMKKKERSSNLTMTSVKKATGNMLQFSIK